MNERDSASGACHEPTSGPRDRLIVAMSVRMARAALGWSQSELGRRLGMTQRSIHRIEQGHSEPRRTTLLAIEHLLRTAGLAIEHRADGGFCVMVPAAVLGNADPVDVTAPSLAAPSLGAPSLAAPSLADCGSVPDRDETTESAFAETVP